MAKKAYLGIEGVARNVRKIYGDDNGVTRMVGKAYLGDGDGVAREWFSSGVPISTLDVGSSVFMNVGGVRTEFLVVHQGLPSTKWDAYDSSCNGTWLLMKDIYEERNFDSNYDYDYPETDISVYLNSTFINKFDPAVKDIIKSAKIRSADWDNYVEETYTRIFLLAADELGVHYDNVYDEEDNYEGDDEFDPADDDGITLDYFSGYSDSKRIAYFNGTAKYWWLRTLYRDAIHPRYYACVITNSGYGGYEEINYQKNGVRPALILPYETLVDGSFNVIA